MKHFHLRNNTRKPLYSTIFEDVTYKNFDIDIIHFCKYIANYFFYRLGLEVF